MKTAMHLCVLLLLSITAYSQSSMQGNIVLDYSALDEIATIDSGGVYHRDGINLNSRLNPSDSNAFGLIWGVINTRGYMDVATGQLYEGTQKVLDSLKVTVSHQNVTGTPDTIQVTVYKYQGTAGVQGNATTIINQVLYDTIVITTTSLSASLGVPIDLRVPNIHVPLAPNEGFVVGVHFYGDTANTFHLWKGWGNRCSGSCYAYPSIFDLNSIWSIVMWTGSTNLSGINFPAYDCDMDLAVGEPLDCEEYPIQNFEIKSYLTYTAAIKIRTARGNRICAGEEVQFIDSTGISNATYQWLLPGATPSVSTLQHPPVIYNTPGTYDVILQITDSSGTIADTLFDYVTVDSLPRISYTKTDITCFGGQDGTITLNVTGGSPPYTYGWSSMSSSALVLGAFPGQYDVTVTDSKGCKAIDSITLTQPQVISPSLSVTDATNCTSCDGEIAVSAVGGVAPYVFSTDLGVVPGSVQTGLCSGIYGFTVTDLNNCSQSFQFPVYGGGSTSPSIGVANDSVFVCSGEPAVVSAHGGVKYLWSPSNYFTDPNLATAVTYPTQNTIVSVNIQDSSSCVDTFRVWISVNANCCDTVFRNTGVIEDSFYVCAPDTVQLEAFGGNGYVWTPSAGISNPTSATPDVYPANTTIYYVAIDYSAGCAPDVYPVTVFVDNDCVWPGDANYDGIANNQDVLYIGMLYGASHLARPNATTNWLEQYSEDWAPVLAPIEAKHLDCDGNGTIDAADTLAVSLNYGLTHNKSGSSGRNSDPALYFDLPDDTLEAGQTVEVPIFLGRDVLPVASFYGIAFSVNYSNLIIEDNVMLAFIPDASFAGTPGVSTLSFSKTLTGASKVDVAHTRINQTTVSGWGQIGVLRFTVRDDISGKDLAQLNLSFSDVKMIDSQGNEQPVYTQDTTLQVTPTVIEDNLLGNLSAYPNPTSGTLMVQCPLVSGETTIKLYNAIGKKLMELKTADSAINRGVELDLTAFSDNVLFLIVENKQHQKALKVIKY